MCICAYMHTYIYIHIYIHIYTYIYMSIYVQLYKCIPVITHTHTRTHTHTYRSRRRRTRGAARRSRGGCVVCAGAQRASGRANPARRARARTHTRTRGSAFAERCRALSHAGTPHRGKQPCVFDVVHYCMQVRHLKEKGPVYVMLCRIACVYATSSKRA